MRDFVILEECSRGSISNAIGRLFQITSIGSTIIFFCSLFDRDYLHQLLMRKRSGRCMVFMTSAYGSMVQLMCGGTVLTSLII
jgi:hypothetical protein